MLYNNTNLSNNCIFHYNNKDYIISKKESLFIDKHFLTYHYKYIDNGYDKLIIMLNGAINRDIAKFPIFQRSSWAEEIQANLLFIDDPTVNESNNLKIGWYLGSSQENAQYIIVNFLKSFFDFLNFDKKEIYIFGSSAGGFAALMLGIHLGINIIVNNTQTVILNYSQSFVDQLINEAFDNMPKEEFKEKYKNRINVLNLLDHTKIYNNIYYYQNIYDLEHYNLHYTPFIQKYIKDFIETDKLNVYLYSNSVEGHNPMSKKHTIHMLNNIVK